MAQHNITLSDEVLKGLFSGDRGVAELAWHADVNMIRRYAKPTQEELVRAVKEAFSSYNF